MSFLRSKHSGWTHELKRTPFGGGGGFISDIGQGISDAVSSVGDALADVDQFVNNEIPGGWITVGGAALGAAAAGGAFAGAGASAGLGTEAAAAFDAALNAGLTTEEAYAAAAGAGGGWGGGAGAAAAADTSSWLASAGVASDAYLTPTELAISQMGGGAASFAPELAAAAGAGSEVIGSGLAGNAGLLDLATIASGGAGAAGAAGAASSGGGLASILGTVGTTAGIVGGLGQLYMASQLANAARPGNLGNVAQPGTANAPKPTAQTMQYADPFGQYRPQMAAQLYNLLANPNTVAQTPGYQFNLSQGLQAMQAQQAAQGRLVGGGALLQAQSFGQNLASQSYNQQVNTLAQLSGAYQAPASALQAAYGTLGQQQNVSTGQANIAATQLGATAGALQAAGSGLGNVLNPLATLYANYNNPSPRA